MLVRPDKTPPQGFPMHPKANQEAVIAGDKYRFTVLTDGLIRYEYSPDGAFEDRASTFAVNRDLPVPAHRIVDKDGTLQIITDRFHLTYDKKEFSQSGLTLDLRGRLISNTNGIVTQYNIQWRYGMQDWPTLGGTARTLDGVDGKLPLGPGIVSKFGWAAIDDSETMMFDGAGWVGSREAGRIDGYLFAYGQDYRQAIKAFYTISGSQPVLPRWALGNWWSRYHEYTAEEYLGLMDRFKVESIPFSVAVLDMDWHLVTDKRVTTSGWTGYTWQKKLIPDPKAFCNALHSEV